MYIIIIYLTVEGFPDFISNDDDNGISSEITFIVLAIAITRHSNSDCGGWCCSLLLFY